LVAMDLGKFQALHNDEEVALKTITDLKTTHCKLTLKIHLLRVQQIKK